MLIDTHVHLGGCIPPSFVWDIIQRCDLKYLAEQYDDVVKQMTFAPTEPKTFHRFLDKFRILDQIQWTEELIDSSIKAVSEYFTNVGADYVWLDFSINKYMSIGWHKKDAILYIHDCFNRYMPNQVGLILSIKYESPKTSQKQYLKVIEDPDVCKCLFGVDLVGDEGYYDPNFYAPLFKDWVKEGKIVRAHVGESQSSANVITAIKELQVTNIAHGIQAANNEDALQLAIDNNVTFDMALASNYITNVVVGDHPLFVIYDRGVKVTIGSDDPVQCGSSIRDEYLSCPTHGLCEAAIKNIKNVAFQNTVNALYKQGRIHDANILSRKFDLL
jgi:adenosine deaminase